MCAFVVLDLVYRYYAKRLAWKNVSKMTCFVSINQVKCEFNGDFAILLTDAAGTKRYNSAGAWTWWFICQCQSSHNSGTKKTSVSCAR